MANTSLCSNGERVTDATAQRRYSISLRTKYETTSASECGGCEIKRSEHNDHTIAKARCKVIGKTELIWHPGNFVRSCAKCHNEWEAFKSGQWLLHKNVGERLVFLKEHDPEGYNIRIELTKLTLEQQLNDEHNSEPGQLRKEIEIT